MPTSISPHSHPVRLILAVAPQTLARGRFAAKENASPALSPAAALAWLDERLALGDTIDTVELAGPGDPLATTSLTLETLDLVRNKYPHLDLLVTSLGIHGERQIKTLVEHGASRLVLEVDAVDREVVQRLYTWIRPATKTIPLAQAAEILLSEQEACIAACKQAGLPVTIRTTVYPGVNDHHIEEIASQAASLGAAAMVILPALPATDREVAIPAPSQELIRTLRALADQHLTIVDAPAESGLAPPSAPTTPATLLPKPSLERPNVAVVSASGMEVDIHLGQATRVLIYGPRQDELISLLGTRPMPAAGGGTPRWEQLAALLPDCFALLAGSAGTNPQAILQDHGIAVLITDGEIEGVVEHLYEGGKKSKRQGEPKSD